MSKQLITLIQVEEYPELNLNQLCETCGVPAEFIHELIEFGIIEPMGYTYESWLFDAEQLRRVRMIVRLQHDLEVNIAGAAVILDLLDEVEELRSKVEYLEKHL